MINTNIKQIAAGFLAAFTFAIAAPSFASTPLNLDGLNGNIIQSVPVTFQGNPENVLAGGFTGSLNGAPTSLFFCIDLRHNIGLPNNYNVNVTNPNAVTAPFLQLASPFNQQVAASMVNHALTSSFGVDTDKYTALQLAIWSVLYNWTPLYHPTNTLGTALDLFSAPLVVDPNILNNALGFLAIADGFVVNNTYSTSYGHWRMMIDAANTPDHVTQTILGTPEPGTYLTMASFLVLGLAVLRRTRKQST